MIKHKKTILFSLILLSFLFVDGTAIADDFVPPRPSTIEVDDGNKIFFITPMGHESDEQLPTGLYYNTEPPELIYLVISGRESNHISYFQDHYVFLSNDGMNFVHIPIPFRFESINSPITFMPYQGVDAVAIEFYANGVMIKHYTVSQLVERHSDLGHTASMIMWQDYGLIYFNADENTISVTTVDGINHIFDITTGESINNRIISIVFEMSLPIEGELENAITLPLDNHMSNIPTDLLIGIIVIIICTFVLIFMIIKKCHKRKNTRRSE
jgi:hypothetical protein